MTDRRQRPDRREEERVPTRGRRADDTSPEELLALADRGEFLTVAQLQVILQAKNLPSHENTVRGWIREGKIQVQRGGSGRIFIPGAEIRAVLRWLRGDEAHSATKPGEVSPA